MAPKKAGDASQPGFRNNRGEVLRFRSPAEFFSENKNIAGFDNPGKSLYTTIRELVENSLDACESISVNPDIDITVQEMDGAELNRVLGVVTHERLDAALFDGGSKGGKAKAAKAAAAKAAPVADGGDDDADEPSAKKQPSKGKSGEAMYYRVIVRDNGCGCLLYTSPSPRDS